MHAYSIIYHGNSFRTFEDRVCEDIATKVVVGNINHSMNFFRRFMASVTSVLRTRIQKFFQEPLACTNKLPPICIKPDKFSKDGKSNQAVVIRHPCLKKGKLFRETYIGHLPADTSTTGKQLTDLMIESVQNSINYDPPSLLRDVFGGIASDGAYIAMHIDQHFAQEMQLPPEFVKQVTIHDYAHKLELVDLHARRDLTWIDTLDKDIKEFMKENKDYGRRVAIQQKCEELNVKFYAFVLYSDTRFAQYRHRTYRVFLDLYRVLYR